MGGSVAAARASRLGLPAVLTAALTAVALLAGLASLAAPASASAPRSPTLAPANTVIAGPSSAIDDLDGMAIARDGTGGLVYRQDVGGVPHVFVSRLINGTFQAPVQADAGLAGASTQPVVAADNGGVLLVAFINAGALYVTSWAGAAAAQSAPAALFAPAANPAISMSNFGKAYLAFTATNGAGGGDVRCAYYYLGQWSLESTPLDINPADAAGVGVGAPAVVAAGDGTGIVAWGENGHIYTRRIVGTTPSTYDEQADVGSLDGWTEVSAGDPSIGAGGNSSYATVAFQETIENAGVQQSRVLVNELQGSQYDGVYEGDGATTGGPEGADQPQTAINEYGDGFATSEHEQTHELFATVFGNNDVPTGVVRVDSLPNSAAPDAVPATAGLISNFIAWQQTPGLAGLPEIRVRYAADGVDFGSEEVVSDPLLGPTEANLGLVAGGDSAGDAAVAWVQGTGAGTQIVAAQLYQPPGGFVASNSFRYSTTADPTLAWSGAVELWGSPTYVVDVDGVDVGQTTALSLALPSALTNGRHTYQVTANNQAGLVTTASAATVFVDTVPPRVSFVITGRRYVGTVLHLEVTDTDAPPGVVTPAQASGISAAKVTFGDGSSYAITHGKYHAYKRRGTYTVTVTVSDRAGNVTTVSHTITIRVKPKPKPNKHKHKGPSRHPGRRR